MRKRSTIAIAVFLLLFFAVWEIAVRAGWLDEQFIPAFSTIIREMLTLAASGQLLIHIVVSFLRILAGTLLAVGIGVPLGFLLAGWAPRLTAFLKPLLTNLSMLNPFTLIPVFIIVLGLGESSKIGLIFWVLIWPVLFSSIAGVGQLDPGLVKAARSMGAKGSKIFWAVILPGSIDRIFTGLKSAVTLGFTVLLGTEMIGSDTGLGWIIHNSQKNYNIPRMYVGIVCIAVLGLLVSLGIEKLQKRIVVWKEDGV
ncbi:MAG: ABC transporter permease [Lachnospiraceae bacterium]